MQWTKAIKQLTKLRQTKKNVHVMQFSNVKVRVLWRDWLIREIKSATREHKRIKRGKRGEKL